VALQEYFSFDVGGQEFALPLAAVLEVVTLPPEVAPVPRTDGAMRGVMALRNRLLPLLDVPVLLGLDASAEGAAPRVVVARLGEARVGLVVDRVRAIVRVAESQVEPVPPVLTRGNQEAQVQSVCRLDGGRRLISILSTAHLLADGLAERLGEQVGQGNNAVEETAASAATEQFLLFTLGDNRFGLPVACVEEVARVPDRLSRLPKAPPFVDGVIELRGRVVPVIDQRRRFAVPESGSAQRRIVVVRIGSDTAGFVVDAVSGIVRLAAGDVQDSPELAVRDNRTVPRVGIAEGHGMVFLIDPSELLDRAERDLVAAMGKDLAAPS
jgi:purine-binding chemotaxis protein CheW